MIRIIFRRAIPIMVTLAIVCCIVFLVDGATPIGNTFDNIKVPKMKADVSDSYGGATILVRSGESIQDAIDMASEGSIIEVQSGTYRENVEVTKALTLRGMGNPVIEASGENSAIKLIANGTVLEGFTVTNAGIAGSVVGGIEAWSSGNIIRDNIAEKNDHGILLWKSSDNTITGNTVTGNAENGFYLLSQCQRNNISDNIILGNNDSGFRIYDSMSNALVGNTIHDNDYGIFVLDSSDNLIYRNKLIDNQQDAYDDLEDTTSGTNRWDDGSIGNYYSNLQCTDDNSDGICESPYSIPGGISVDRYPVAGISGFPQTKIVSKEVSGAALIVRPGESIQDAIDMASEGCIIEVQSGTYRENIEVTKALTLRGVGNPVVEARGENSAIKLVAEGVVLEGFTVTNAGVSGSIVGGIEAWSSGNIIRDNIAEKSDHGILLWKSSDNTVTGNTVTGNAEHGLYLLSQCQRNNISDNVISDNNDSGIHIYNSTGNKIGDNIVRDNGYGIYILESWDNLIYRNDLIDNHEDAYDNFENTSLSTNNWDDGSIGNYYSNLQCTDSNSDGVCDSPYGIPGGISVDRYPMVGISEISSGKITSQGTMTEAQGINSSTTISSLQSGSVSNSDGVRVDVPAGAVPPNEDGSPGKMVFSIEKDTTLTPSLQGDLSFIGSVYRLGPEGFVFNQPVEVTLPIPEGVDLNGVMGITTFNDSSNQWELIPGTVDLQSRIVTIKTDHFSAYGIFGWSGSTDPEAWNRAHGGWIRIMNSHSRQSPPYYSECSPADTGRREHCRGLTTSISHGVCILSATLDDPSLNYLIPRNLPWSIIASDWHERSIAPQVEKVWVPAGTYTVQEELGISEVNDDPLYSPCCQVKANPPTTVLVNPGAIVDFEDYSAFHEGPGTICDYCPMCSSAGSRPRGTAVLTGDVQVTLTWHAEADIDLYVEDPQGDEVWYSNPSVPSGGQLDRDNNCGDFEIGKPENIYWPEGGAPDGTYRVRVNYYGDCSDAGPVRWTVRVVVGSVAKTYTGTLESVGETQEVTTFEKGAV